MAREGGVDDVARVLERGGGAGREAPAEVQDALGRHAERRAGRPHGHGAPDVERDARHREARAPRGAQQRHHLLIRRAVLGAQVQQRVAGGVGGLEPEQEPAAEVEALDPRNRRW